MKRGVVIILLLTLSLVFTTLKPIFAASIDKKITEGFESQVSTITKTIKESSTGFFQRLGKWITETFTKKVSNWWEVKGKIILISFWNQILDFLNTEIYIK